MTYFISDIHGEYDLFLKLLDKIGFRDSDRLIVLGDVIGKGLNAVKLVDFLRSSSNIDVICGNHEYDFINYYTGLMRSYDGGDIEYVFSKLKKFFPTEGDRLTFDAVDYLESLPYYIETENYICVHAGVETNGKGMILPMRSQRPEYMVYDRNFKEDFIELDVGEKTVLFGHTPCSYKNGTGSFIKTPKSGVIYPSKITDYSKIRLDCGVFITGMLGCLCLETAEEFYVNNFRL